jgi:hypothetical protein
VTPLGNRVEDARQAAIFVTLLRFVGIILTIKFPVDMMLVQVWQIGDCGGDPDLNCTTACFERLLPVETLALVLALCQNRALRLFSPPILITLIRYHYFASTIVIRRSQG